MLNTPRPGKKLLVADIDYTIFDLNSSAERPDELARPYLHQFFAAAYADYDIVIWRCRGNASVKRCCMCIFALSREGEEGRPAKHISCSAMHTTRTWSHMLGYVHTPALFTLQRHQHEVGGGEDARAGGQHTPRWVGGRAPGHSQQQAGDVGLLVSGCSVSAKNLATQTFLLLLPRRPLQTTSWPSCLTTGPC